MPPTTAIEVYAEVVPAADGATPALVFANAIGTNLHIWDAVVSALTWPGPVIRYDKRGHGRSPTPDGPYTLDDHVADLAQLLDRHAATPAIVCGLSVGGLIAQGLAISHPDAVSALILCDTGPKVGSPEMWAERIAAIETGGMEPLADAILMRWFSAPWAAANPAAVAHWREVLVTTPVAGYTGTCAAIAGADLRAAITTMAKPALLLGGSADIATPPDAMRAFADMLPDARFQEIPDAGHLPSIENPAAVAEAIAAFAKPFCAAP